MGHKLLLILLAFVTVWSPNSSAQGSSNSDQFYFEESFFPEYVSKNDINIGGGHATKQVSTESGLGYELQTTLGYIWSSILFGVTFNYYHLETNKAVTEDFEGYQSKVTRSEWGPTLGFFLGSWRLSGTYFIAATKKAYERYRNPGSGTVGTDETYFNKAGSGYQVALGYDFVLGAGFGISPLLVYHSIKYKKQSSKVGAGSAAEYESTTLETPAIDEGLKPMVNISFRF